MSSNKNEEEIEIMKEEKLEKDEYEKKFKFSTITFNNKFFDVVKVDFENISLIKFYYKNSDGHKIENITQLKSLLSSQGKELMFAMNGGIFAEDFKPLGLYIENGKKISEINLNEGEGNFYLKPNGIFVIQNNFAKIVKSESYKNSSDDLFVVQSGPLLLIDNKINSNFKENSENKYIRNGVGVTEDGNVFFVIFDEPVTLHDFTLFFKNQLHCMNALYLDGTISEMYISDEREKTENNFSVIIGIIKE